ncbi:hypothetical protein C8F04DRAFT_963264 [Mycena alexandri]|uniref:Uncharacterized protein n=1 Tax=Mycena alexandri TaxID=1745969 RepID=A0AAD6X1V0_9AGAR|nr:hypothetical protein C8F04DRAFT_963264 [Mycena alexandri]
MHAVCCATLSPKIQTVPGSPRPDLLLTWHYIGHRATDILCRLWCNPAPLNGSQPDLILVKEDADGTTHQTRAFNTETAEQLNSWLNGFESQLRQMSDVNYDLFIHVLMMLYGERVEARVREQGLGTFGGILAGGDWGGMNVDVYASVSSYLPLLVNIRRNMRDEIGSKTER